jgi:hypothetical protein
MKKLFIFIVPITLIGIFSCSDDPQTDLVEERASALQVLENFSKAHEERNLDLLLSCFSNKPDIIILGTDENELWIDKVSFGQSQKSAYETFSAVKLSERDKVLHLCKTGGQAWFYMRVNWYLESEGKQFTFDGIRTTGVLEKENDKWQIVQLHTSLPVKGQVVAY